VPEQELDLLQFAARFVTRAHVRRRSWDATPALAHAEQARLTTPQITSGLKPCEVIRPALLIARKIGPAVIFASDIQAHRAVSIQDGPGTVLT
jgi:hypothetical protein